MQQSEHFAHRRKKCECILKEKQQECNTLERPLRSEPLISRYEFKPSEGVPRVCARLIAGHAGCHWFLAHFLQARRGGVVLDAVVLQVVQPFLGGKGNGTARGQFPPPGNPTYTFTFVRTARKLSRAVERKRRNMSKRAGRREADSMRG